MTKKYITRTIRFTAVEVVAFDVSTMHGNKKVVPVPVDLKSDKAAFKYFTDTYVCDNYNIKLVATRVVGHFEKLYGMPVEAFVNSAEELDPHDVRETGIEVV